MTAEEPWCIGVNGQFTASYYNGSGGAFDRVLKEIRDRFDTSRNIYFIAADITYPESVWRGGGQAYLGGATIVYIPFDDEPFTGIYLAGHELGHSFGLRHDFRRLPPWLLETYIMSYSGGRRIKVRLSKCAAEWLNVHPYFNARETSPNDEPTTIRLLSPLVVPPNAVSLRFEVTDADGLHQAQLMIPRKNGFSLHRCKSLNGSRSSTIEFIVTELTARDSNRVSIGIIDVHGNFRWKLHSIYVDDALERVDGVIDIGDLAPKTIRYFYGNDQIGYLNARLTEPFVVSVLDAGDKPVPGIQVTFQVIAGDGHLSVTNPWTDSDGRARSFLTLGSFQGEYRVVASVSGVSEQVTFSATAKANTTIVTGTPQRTLTGHTDAVQSVAYSSDGTLATGSHDRTVRLWDAVTGEQKAKITGFTHKVFAVAYSSDGRTLATSGNWGETRLWDAVTGQHKQTLEGITSLVSALAYSPDGRTLATGDLKGEIRLWDAVTGQYKATLTGHTDDNVLNLAFSADSRTLASSSSIAEGTVRLWDAVTGQLFRTFTVFTERDAVRASYYGVGVSFSPVGRTFATTGASDLKIRLWDTTSRQPLRTLTGHTTGSFPVAFSPPDGAILATGSADSEIRLWDVGTGQQLAILIGHTERITSVAFSPDGNTLASGSVDHTVKLWDMSPYVTPQTLAADFDGDGTVGFPDFLLFVAQFGSSQGDAGYDARFDLDGDGMIGFSDFLIFVNAFGEKTS